MAKATFIITAGLGYGDEGKGSMVDFLVRHHGARYVVRYGGGPQAAHYVVTPEGLCHCFSQFGSGTLVPGVRTHISRHMLIKPQNFVAEAEELSKKGVARPFSLVSIDPRCTVVTPWHAMIGQLLELSRGKERHGTVGMGVGQAAMERERPVNNSLTIGDAFDGPLLAKKIEAHRIERLREAEELLQRCSDPAIDAFVRHFADEGLVSETLGSYKFLVNSSGIQLVKDEEAMEKLVESEASTVFEGSQGALIDYHYGFWPYVTKTRTTIDNAEALMKPYAGKVNLSRIGIIRAYNYRHGPGPLVTEDRELSSKLDEGHNVATDWQGGTRAGWPDLLSWRYALAINRGIESLALTMLDRLTKLDRIKVCTSYEYTGEVTDKLDDYFEWERMQGGAIRIKALKVVPHHKSEERSRLLFKCVPDEFIEFIGPAKDISGARRRGDLPSYARDLIEYIESPDGLSLPVRIISSGPTADHKFTS
ncbi:MAG: adenylosuccinate synthetase [Candidatus Eremiobacteraeota bacterium]|nr:adenylosuccinate synthetase [Candidatus Eremiobacteraeota bacterium]